METRSRFPALLVASLLACGACGTDAFVPASTRIPIGRSIAGVCSRSRGAHVLGGGAVASGLLNGRARWAMKASSNDGGGYTAAEASDKRKNPDLYDSSVSISDSPASQNPGSSGGRVGVVPLRKPEVLSPAGGWPQLRAAVQNGCDAVYFGLDHFNARARASNFDSKSELPEVMKYLHERGVHGYVTLNILIFDTELEELEEMVRCIAKAGVDAVIVQDMGAVELIKRVAPNLEVHGSTQMSITSAEGARFARRQGVSRVVLGRELSVKEIGKVAEEYEDEIEVFVHGALCVSYSGQCFSSEAWGGRSANRGQCAQACRMPYGLLVNGELRELGDIKYLLSPQDLMAVELVPDLIRSGVSCFKIEGRLKGPEYVALTTKVYREAIDRAWVEMGLDGGGGVKAVETGKGKGKGGAVLGAMPGAEPGSFLTKEVDLELRQVFARGQDGEFGGLTKGFLEGPKHQMLVRGRNPRHRGVLVGEVVGITQAGVQVRLRGPIKRGDGVVFDCGRPEDREEGGSVYEVMDKAGRSVGKVGEEEVSSGAVVLTFGRGAVDMRRVSKGDLVWRNRDTAMDKRLEALVKSGPGGTIERVGVSCEVSGSKGGRLVVKMRDGEGREGVAESESDLVEANNRGADHESISRAVGTLGGTDLRLASLDTSGLGAGLFIPVGEIKEARRAAVEALMMERVIHKVADGMRPLEEGSVVPSFFPTRDQEEEGGGGGGDGRAGDSRVRVLCRTRAQAEAALTLEWLDEVTLDFLEVHGLVEAVAAVKASGKRCVVATPRVLKPDEERMWKFFLKLEADALLIRSAGMLQQLLDMGGTGAEAAGYTIPALFGDFSLNAANVISTTQMLRQGISRLTPTHDLDSAQLCALATSLGPDDASNLEVIIHQHLPIFHTEHCVFCRFLSDGENYKDCGHPCETNTVHLRDHDQKDHLVLADMGCRNTVFNAQAQSGATFVSQLQRSGFTSFRIELVDEPAHQVKPLLQGYHSLINGKISARDLWAELQFVPDANGNAQGVSSGSLRPGSEHVRDKASMKKTAAQIDPKWSKKIK